MSTPATTVNLVNMEVWKDALDAFLQKRLNQGFDLRPNYIAMGKSLDSSNVTDLPLASPVTVELIPRSLSIQIAQNLITIANDFEKTKFDIGGGSGKTETDGVARLQEEKKETGESEATVLREIKSLNGSLNIKELADILKKNLNERTVEASLDYITGHVDGWPRVALSFDLVAAIYATRAVVGNVGWVKDVATSYLIREHVIPDGDVDNMLQSEDLKH